MVDAPTLGFITLIVTVIVQVIMHVSTRKYFEGKFGQQVQDHEKCLDEMKSTVRYKDTCDALFNGHEARITTLEHSKFKHNEESFNR